MHRSDQPQYGGMMGADYCPQGYLTQRSRTKPSRYRPRSGSRAARRQAHLQVRPTNVTDSGGAVRRRVERLPSAALLTHHDNVRRRPVRQRERPRLSIWRGPGTTLRHVFAGWRSLSLYGLGHRQILRRQPVEVLETDSASRFIPTWFVRQ